MGHSSERADSFSQQTMLFCTFPQKTPRERDLDSKLNYPYRYEHWGSQQLGSLDKGLWSREAKAPEVWVLLEMRLSGSSSSSSPLSSGMASSGMACIWTPGAWGSILRFSNSRCLWPMVERLAEL